MRFLQTQIEEAQKAVCRQHAAEYVATPGNSKAGFATSTKDLIPINGLRHSAVGETSGWYIWCGEMFSEASNFFVPLHAYHLYEDYPQIAPLLGLPPGYRFLVAGDHLDVWYDATLLNT
jgi:hypothetical protein